MGLTLPNFLTLIRIAAIIPIVALFYVDAWWSPWTAFALFAAAGITDFLDGYLARATGQVSKLGRFLDPVADKLLVSAVILMLVATGNLSGLAILPGLIILLREIAVSGLREILAELRVGMPVSNLAKWKTTIQMLALGFLIVGNAGPDAIPCILIGEVLIWIAGALTIITGFDYLRAGVPTPDGNSGAIMVVLGIAGYSGAGKTTLVKKLIPALTARGLSVSTVKHAHHKFDVDTPGKDSYEHRHAGATEVLVSSANRWALMHENRDSDEPGLPDLLQKLSPVDLVLVEGWKFGDHKKLEVYRPGIGKPLLATEDKNVVAVASDAAILPGVGVPVLNIDDITAIADFVAEYATVAGG